MANTAFPWVAFERLVGALACRIGSQPTVERIRMTPWSSMSFSGHRICFALWLDGAQGRDRATALTDDLDYTEFDLGDRILADILVMNQSINRAGARIEIEALLLANE
ncbi:hypothetical protein HFP51_01460 [Parasphingopyxis sp. CP4]|uniref:hypothetical protein n=1 Tax=Parasphingopyxis sp. CP4 TaxID=2724527 RepID=UPI0015A29FE1|nr:hypothetical protein [Parasphingopyxis sp. CP4]QLC20968.1 hypothetical protein HFP51_01460 [Parasphingopyxis sp. CP4]